MIDEIVDKAITELEYICNEAGIDASHGIDHAKRVLSNLDNALLNKDDRVLSDERILSLRLAALLHDVDDKKYFPETYKTLLNAKTCCKKAGASDNVINDVVTMINLVSCSSNGNSYPQIAKENPEYLWPRWADRLEAVGEIGVVRCYMYNSHKGEPMCLDGQSPRPSNKEDVLNLATQDRFEEYQTSGGKSLSMMDHYYDKLIPISNPPEEMLANSYYIKEFSKRLEPLLQVCLSYGKTGQIPLDIIKNMAVNVGLGDAINI